MLPAIPLAKPVGTFQLLVSDPGDQVDPAIDGQFVVYAGPGPSGDLDVFLRDILGGTQIIAGGPGPQDSPDVFLSTAIYRTQEGIVIETWTTDRPLRTPPQGGDGPVSNPVVHSAVAAWEHQRQLPNGTTDMDIVVSRYVPGIEYVLRTAGDTDPAGNQHSPAAFGDLVAYIDDARGSSVWLHDSAQGPSNWKHICDGVASGVSIGFDGTKPVIAVARNSGGPTGEDIEIYDRDGNFLTALPGAGPQSNPHLSGEWVAFDDHSSTFSQVAVWRWKTPPGDSNLVFVPHPSQTDQRLNDLSLVPGEEVRVVFVEDAGSPSGRDIALYRLPIDPIVFDGEPNGWPIVSKPPVDCASADATVLATLDVTREEGKPEPKSVAFDVDPPAGRDALPVLVCIHAVHVSSASVFLGGDAVARPEDFEPHVVDLSRPSEVKRGRASLSARLEGKPGSRLTVRVLADPDRGDVCRDDDDDRRDGDGHHGRERARRKCGGGGGGSDPSTAAPAAPPAPDRSGGCGNAGGLASLLSLAVLFARRRLRV
ncbi:MAG TPA: hypothetical protein VIV57_04335 [Anaeromyxobacter sp.]